MSTSDLHMNIYTYHYKNQICKDSIYTTIEVTVLLLSDKHGSTFPLFITSFLRFALCVVILGVSLLFILEQRKNTVFKLEVGETVIILKIYSLQCHVSGFEKYSKKENCSSKFGYGILFCSNIICNSQNLLYRTTGF